MTSQQNHLNRRLKQASILQSREMLGKSQKKTDFNQLTRLKSQAARQRDPRFRVHAAAVDNGRAEKLRIDNQEQAETSHHIPEIADLPIIN